MLDTDHHDRPLQVGSLFGGYGGLDLAVEHVFNAETVWFSEINEPVARVFAHHWPDAHNLGDITTINWSGVPAVDILCGGFPCLNVKLRPRGVSRQFWMAVWLTAYAVVMGAEQLRFQTTIGVEVKGDTWSCVEIPGSAEFFGTGKTVRVDASIDDVLLENVGAMVTGTGGHMVSLNAKVRKTLGKDVGDTVDVTITKR